MTKVVEILQYRLQAGSGERFHHLMQHVSVPLHKAAGITVLEHGVSLHDPDAYYLMRRFDGMAEMEQVLQAFYRSQAWLEGPRTEIVALIEESHRVVLPYQP
ncbi:NIPSNAP family protein [Serratia fonticola]|uniref:NIPSNAP family protein n=1 Tax=Serratia fonticola TaxID=47917 RepID=UPI00192B2572|nr:NIPSNAP family protein [Serratia fonticola]MBL5902445.1 NIPSNAP family protein [Serratia fonticola]MDK2375130.1 NIPSNAP family protein [Serratia fonticola]